MKSVPIKGMILSLVAGCLLWAGQASATLLGIGASVPDFQFLGSTVSYAYDSTAGQGQLSITHSLATIDVQWKDENGNSWSDNPDDGDGANGINGSFLPVNFQLDLVLQATLDNLGNLVSSATNTVTVSGIMDFSPYSIATNTVLLSADLTQVGFDAGSQTLDFLATATGGHPDFFQAGVFEDEVGVLATQTGFSSWTENFSAAAANVDVTTPNPQAVPAPAVFYLLLAGLFVLRKKLCSNAR